MAVPVPSNANEFIEQQLNERLRLIEEYFSADGLSFKVAKELNKTEKWHVHGYGISIHVLRKDLKLQIDDFGENPELDGKIRGYYDLLDDYMIKRGNKGVIHMDGLYQPFM